MGLLQKFTSLFSKNKYREANYLSLILTGDRVAALIWTFEQGQIKELGFGQKSFTNPDLLLHQAAVAIDTAGEEAKSDFEKTVFGISSYWMEDGQLSQKSTKILKKLADELELDPQAFVPLAASINHLLKIEKFPSPQVIAIGIFGTKTKDAFCEVHLIDKNKIVDTKTTQLPPTDQNIKRLVEQLQKDDHELPAKIVIFGIREDEELARDITKIDWDKTFMHEPKIEFLDDKALARAVAYAQAADLLGHEPESENEVSKDSDISSSPAPVDSKQPEEVQKANELGFVEGEDILLKKEQTQTSAEDESRLIKPEETAPLASSNETYAVEVENHNPQHEYEKPKLKLPAIFKFPNLARFFQNPQKLAITLAILTVLAIFASFLAGQFLTKAQVTIKVQAIEHRGSFTATVPDQIPGQTLKGVAAGNQKAVTTGSKKVGDPAKGEAGILNWTTSPKSFSKETAIIAANGLKFTLDSDVEVASRSASTPGKNKVGATAQEVGESSNLPQGTEFTFVQFDQIAYSAQAESAFTGGSERQVTVVTQQDMDRLEKSLTETTVARAKEDLKSKTSGKTILDSAINIKITRKNFDSKLDQEASLLTLDMEIEVETTVFDENDLKNFLAEDTNKSLEDDSQARPENIEILEVDSKKQAEGLTLSGKFKANLVPKFNEQDLKKQIAAKSPKEVRSLIKQTPQVADVEVNYSPNIPFITSIPRDPRRISFKIETN